MGLESDNLQFRGGRIQGHLPQLHQALGAPGMFPHGPWPEKKMEEGGISQSSLRR